jgi:hypothetical protein
MVSKIRKKLAEKSSQGVAFHRCRVFHSAAAGPYEAGGERRCGKLAFSARAVIVARGRQKRRHVLHGMWAQLKRGQ